jgi:polyhydroxyalkanoate synthesis regulator phasin
MTNPEGSPPWLETWMSAQRELWDSMLAGRPPDTPPPSPQPFMQAFSQGLPESSRDVASRMLEFGESYLGVTRQAWKALEAAQGASVAQADLARQLESMKSQFAQGFAQVFPGPPGAPGAVPAFGPGRERQQSAERLARAAMRYQQAFAAFTALLGRVSGGAVDRLAQRLGESSGAGKAPDSLRAVYDLWVDCGEQAYAAAAHTPEFAKAQSELNDALLDLRREQQKQVEDWARALDLPTRAEVNTLIKRVNTLRRRMRELEEELEQLRRSR